MTVHDGGQATMQALILAGGLGTRLRPLVSDRNKTIAPIAERPFLEYPLRQLRNAGNTDVILCVAHLGQRTEEQFASGERWGLTLRYAHEPEPLGTAGAIKHAEGLIRGDTFLVLNGDSFFDLDLAALVHSHRERGAVTTIALASVEDSGRYGAVELDSTGQIRRFTEKGAPGRAGLINAGVYVFERTILNAIPAGRAVSLEREILPALIGHGLYGRPFTGYFVDIGVPAEYRRLLADPGPLLAAVG